MKKKDIVKSNILFNEIINKGKKINSNYYIIYKLKNSDNYLKFGIAVGKKVGNAVTRNKIKRRIKNIIDNNINLFIKGNYYIIICKKDILDLNYQQMENVLVNILNKGENNEK